MFVAAIDGAGCGERSCLSAAVSRLGAKRTCQRFAVAYDLPGRLHARRLRLRRTRPSPTRCAAASPTSATGSRSSSIRACSAAMPALERAIRRYAAAHAGSLAIEGDIVVVPGGEEAKTRAGRRREPPRRARAARRSTGTPMRSRSAAARCSTRSAMRPRSSTAACATSGFPTTVLAQADSGVGVKNAVNAFGVKNLVGTFAPPFAIINDGAFIDHLPPREKRGGMAEAVKVALIRDRDFFEWIEANADALAVFHPNTPRPADRALGASSTCARSPKAAIPFETGLGAPARLRPLVGAQAREPDRARGQPRRGGRDRRRARHALFGPGRPPAGGRGRARAPPPDDARLQPLVRRARRGATADGQLAILRGLARVPGASRRRADRDAHRRASVTASRSTAMDHGADRGGDRLARRARSG